MQRGNAEMKGKCSAKESECRWVHVLVVFACELEGEGMCNEWCFVMHG